jgi:hypothetical protein
MNINVDYNVVINRLKSTFEKVEPNSTTHPPLEKVEPNSTTH